MTAVSLYQRCAAALTSDRRADRPVGRHHRPCPPAQGVLERQRRHRIRARLAGGVVALAGTGSGSASLDAALGASYSEVARTLLIAVVLLGAPRRARDPARHASARSDSGRVTIGLAPQPQLGFAALRLRTMATSCNRPSWRTAAAAEPRQGPNVRPDLARGVLPAAVGPRSCRRRQAVLPQHWSAGSSIWW